MVYSDLYMRIKDYITNNIYKGIYKEGEKIPSERVMAETLGVSRVTIRKSLSELEKEGLLEREVGSGTKIYFNNKGHAEELDAVCLVAKARNPFFAEFIAELQRVLDEEDILLIYVQKSKKESIEDCIFRLYQRGLHNAIIWPGDEIINLEKIKRLRGIGMNMCFFDTEIGAPYGDCIYMDNDNAIKSLIKFADKKGAKGLYLGWDNEGMFSVQKREQAVAANSKKRIEMMALGWNNKEKIEEEIKKAFRLIDVGNFGEYIICGDGEIGLAVSRVAKEIKNFNARLFSIDEFELAKDYEVTTIRQDFKASALLAYKSINEQCENSKKWKANTYRIKGIPIERY